MMCFTFLSFQLNDFIPNQLKVLYGTYFSDWKIRFIQE